MAIGLRQAARRALAIALTALLALGMSMGLAACGSSSDESASGVVEGGRADPNATYDPPEVEGLTYDHQADLKYATQFDVYYYNDGYKVISSHGDSRDYLIVPEGAAVPENLPDNMYVLQQPLDHIYLAATASMALFDAIGGIDDITMSGLDADDWYIQDAKDAINDGRMAYAGKYSQPDYEMFVSKGCSVAIESTMILHTPDVQEKIEELGVPVFIERSSFETEPLGRSEWVKAFAAMLNKEDAADEFFDKQVQIVSQIDNQEPTGKTVAFFAINSDGSVNVRKPSDYMAKMIETAGGTYAFDDLKEQGNSTVMRISMEEFYEQGKDVDFLIYNGTIDGGVNSVQAIVDKDATFSSFKAIQENHVYGIGPDMYQRTDQLAQMINDLHIIVTQGDESQLAFIKHLS